ncbi:MAG: hypothetical protein ACHQT8_06710 [Chlamydiales bacterium]
MLSKQERASLNDFFSTLLFQEGGAYTLFGNKPMTFTTLLDEPHEDTEEFLAQSPHQILCNELNFEENWNVWKKITEHIQTPRFILCKRASPSFSTQKESIFLVNIAETATTLKKHYALFRGAVTRDFDPLKMVFELENSDSSFWKKVLARHDLVGILLGYGDQNAWLFAEARKCEEVSSNARSAKEKEFLLNLAKQTPSSNSISEFDLNFPLPSFVCFDKEQSLALIKEYERDRKKIKEAYKGKDSVDVTLKKLTSSDLSPDPDLQYKERLRKSLRLDTLH